MREKNIINSKNLHRCLLPFMAVTLIAVSFVVFLGSFHGTSVLINLLRYLAIFNIAIGFALLFIAIAINQKENNSDTIEIQTEKTYLQLHYDLLKLAESEKNINEFAPKILRKVCKTFDFDVCELWLIDESKNILRCIDIWHKESQELK